MAKVFYRHYVSVRSDVELDKIYSIINRVNREDLAEINCQDNNDWNGVERVDAVPEKGGPYILMKFDSDEALNEDEFKPLCLDWEFNREQEAAE